nr:unnamed protein product [Callosobruchus chinensis]
MRLVTFYSSTGIPMDSALPS